jgi:hypothetical protein
MQRQSCLQELVGLPELAYNALVIILVHPRLSFSGICLQAQDILPLLCEARLSILDSTVFVNQSSRVVIQPPSPSMRRSVDCTFRSAELKQRD